MTDQAPTHLAGWQQSVDQATMGAINALTDRVLSSPIASAYVVPVWAPFIHWGYAVGPSLTRAQVRAPSLGVKRMDLEFVPARRGTEIVLGTGPSIWIPRKPLKLVPGENLQVFAAEDGAGATQQTAFLQLGPETLPPMPAGDIRAIRLTGTATLAARAWTQASMTPDTTLEAGVYKVVGFVPVSANAVMARMVLEGGGPSPGVPAIAQTAGNPVDLDPAIWYPLMGYDMGTFRSTAIPAFEFYSTVADTAETVYLYAIKIGDLPTA